MMRHSLLGAAGLATTAGLLFQALPASADGLTALLSQLPGNVQALSRVPGPEGSGTGFYVVRETQGDRLFIGRSTSDGQDIDEVSEAGAIGGRVTGLRSESDELGRRRGRLHERSLNDLLRFSVQSARSLVKQHDSRLTSQRTRDCDALSLAS